MSETDRRLKDHLNANQATRERMCLEILATLNGYRNIKPRLPKGGPDGGRDIQATYEDRLCFGAVGFVNDATDLQQHRTQIENKFESDLIAASQATDEVGNRPEHFVFFTNVGLTPGIIDGLKKTAVSMGMTGCDVIDRERLRITLDSNKGYAIRFRYLDLPLTDAEQKDFFSTWAEGISSLVSAGLNGLDEATKRIQFLLESQMLVDTLTTVVRLDDSLAGVSEGEFVFQTMLFFRAHVDGLTAYHYGGGNEPIVETLEQWEAKGKPFTKNGQYGYAFASLVPDTPQYKTMVEDIGAAEHPKTSEGQDTDERFYRVNSSSGILEIDRRVLSFEAGHEPFVFRSSPAFKLIDLHSSFILFDCNRALAVGISSISIHANGYELLKLEKADWKIEKAEFSRFRLPKEAWQTEDIAEWALLRPSKFSSNFEIDLIHSTPRRYNWP